MPSADPSVDIAFVIQQAERLRNQVASMSRETRSNMEQFRTDLGTHWQAPEMAPINQAIGRIIADLNGLTNELTALGADIAAAARAKERAMEQERSSLAGALANGVRSCLAKMTGGGR